MQPKRSREQARNGHAYTLRTRQQCHRVEFSSARLTLTFEPRPETLPVPKRQTLGRHTQTSSVASGLVQNTWLKTVSNVVTHEVPIACSLSSFACSLSSFACSLSCLLRLCWEETLFFVACQVPGWSGVYAFN